MDDKSGINTESNDIEQKLQARRAERDRLRRTLLEIYNIFGVNVSTPIDDGGPNELVPQGLIYNEAAGKLFEYLKSKGVKFLLDTYKKTENGYSSRRGKYIFLGLKTPRRYTKYMGIAKNVNEDTKTQIVFLHEMCHHLARELLEGCGSFQKLFKICKSLREKRPQDGASNLADMNFYQSRGINDQATEDCVELLRIYFMCRKDESQCFESIKHKLHLSDDTACKTVFNLLSESVTYRFPTR